MEYYFLDHVLFFFLWGGLCFFFFFFFSSRRRHTRWTGDWSSDVCSSDLERQVVEPVARRQRERADRFRLVGLAVAEERPYARVRGVGDAARVQVAVEARLVDRVARPQAHRHGRVLPELRHEPWVRVRRQALAAHDLAAEVIELRLAEPALEERARVHAGRGVALIEDLVARLAVVLAAEEVVEPDLVEARRGRVRG